jgi:hypothetical protein
MRKRFEQQMTIGSIPIGETKITTKKRSGALPGLCAALKEIFITPEWNERVFDIPGDLQLLTQSQIINNYSLFKYLPATFNFSAKYDANHFSKYRSWLSG